MPSQIPADQIESLLVASSVADSMHQGQFSQDLMTAAKDLFYSSTNSGSVPDGPGPGPTPDAGWVSMVVISLLGAWNVAKEAGQDDAAARDAAIGAAMSALTALQGSTPPVDEVAPPVDAALAAYTQFLANEPGNEDGAIDAAIAVVMSIVMPSPGPGEETAQATYILTHSEIGDVLAAADGSGFLASASNKGALFAHVLGALQNIGIPPLRALTLDETRAVLAQAILAYTGADTGPGDDAVVVAFAASTSNWGL